MSRFSYSACGNMCFFRRGLLECCYNDKILKNLKAIWKHRFSYTRSLPVSNCLFRKEPLFFPCLSPLRPVWWWHFRLIPRVTWRLLRYLRLLMDTWAGILNRTNLSNWFVTPREAFFWRCVILAFFIHYRLFHIAEKAKCSVFFFSIHPAFFLPVSFEQK